MLGDSQDQVVGENAVAIQAARDVHYHGGLTLADVQTAFTFFMEMNFPRLQEEARRAAEMNVNDFARQMAAELEREATKVLVEKFKDPDVQAALNDAVNSCARRGDGASPDLLAKLIVHRMGADTTPFLDVVLCEAVTTVPRLTREQLGFLVLVHSAKSMGITEPTFERLEEYAQLVAPVAASGMGLSEPQRRHLVYAGVVSTERLPQMDVQSLVFKELKNSFPTMADEEFASQLESQSPSYMKLVQAWGLGQVPEVNLTSVGTAIALAMLAPAFPSLPFSKWLR